MEWETGTKHQREKRPQDAESLSAAVQLTNGSCAALLSSFRLELNEERMPTGEKKTEKRQSEEETPRASEELIKSFVELVILPTLYSGQLSIM